MVDAVEDRAVPVDLDALEDVRVVPDDDVCAGVDCRARERTLVLRELRADERDALVEGDRDDVDLGCQGSDIRLHRLERLVVG